MNAQDRNAIESVFARIQEVEQQGAPRDNEAERLIQQRLQNQPQSAYYLAQTVLVQQEALKNAQQRIQELETRSSASSGQSGLSSAGFGRREGAVPSAPAATPTASGFGRNAGGSAGGGFLAGAMQTALGVAGGMMLGNMLGGLFGSGEAQASEAPAEDAAPDSAAGEYEPQQDYADDAGGFDDI
jgi:hypothetical protein